MKETLFATITKDEIKEAYKYQKKIGWTFNNEKELTDSMLNNRFNFMLLAYSLFLNTYFLVNDNTVKLQVLFIGLFVISFLYIPIFRAYTRYNLVIKILISIDDKEVVPIIFKECKKIDGLSFIPPSSINGLIIPIFMILSFIVGIVYNLFIL
jgi:hypothetical protein